MSGSIDIHIQNLSKRYKSAAKLSLDQVSLTINSGERYGVLGPNGAGKTTLISIMCGILSSSSGTVEYRSEGKVLSPKEIQGAIGFVPQDFAFYQELTPTQNLEYFGALYNLNKEQIKTQSKHLLGILGLSEVAHKKVGTFSGGMKRRVNLAIGIIHQPKILFLDEPTVGVDVQSKSAIIRFLEELNKAGTTIIYTSHHLAEAQEFCTTISLIDAGQLIASDKTGDLLKKNNSDSLETIFIALTGKEYRDHV